MSEPELIPVFVPSLVSLLLRNEEDKGAPLTEGEVLAIRDKSVAVMVPRANAAEMTRQRGYEDLHPELCWSEWQAIRSSLPRRNSGIKLDYYEGGMGPTLLLRGQSLLAIETVRDLFRELARRPGTHVSVRDVGGFDVATEVNLILEHPEGGMRRGGGLELRAEGHRRTFVLRLGEDGWMRCVDLLNGLTGAGHQYLVEDRLATLKVSMDEYPWDKSFRD